MKFVDLELIYVGIAICIGLGLLFWKSQKTKQKRIELLISAKLLPKLAPSWSKTLQLTKLTLLLLSVSLLFIALARPQWGSEKKTSEPTGIDLLIALDVSKSMLARDVRPNRLMRVKLGITNLLDRVHGDRLGLIAFSGSAFLQCPLTLDHQAFSKTLNDLEVGIIKTHGTNMASPIEEAARSFSEEDRDRFLILISDGEDLEGEGLKRAKQAQDEGIRIFTIGIGSENGAKIPMGPIGDREGNFLQDPQGNTVISKMDKKALQDIAEATGGRYYPLGPTGEGLARVLEELQTIGQQKKREQLSTELPIDRYQPFVIISLLLLLFEMLTSNGRKKISGATLACVSFIACLLAGCLKQDNIKRAEEAIAKGDSAAAAGFYLAEVENLEDEFIDPKLLLNAGLAFLEAGSLDEAERNLDQALGLAIEDPTLQSVALNGLGNVFYLRANSFLDEKDVANAKNAWNSALEKYQAASLLDGNPKADENLASLRKQLEERIQSMICKMTGKIWRDLNGDGRIQKDEPELQGVVYWDKNSDGEHNSSLEPMVKTDENGLFTFEWISANYPVPIRLGTKLIESNGSSIKNLVPLYPPPPPPENPTLVRNYYVSINEPGKLGIPIAYRAAPVLRGNVWTDVNGNAKREREEGGSASATLFLDGNGNFQMDENETSFKPEKDGNFERMVSPGQHSLCIKPDNPDANVTFPIEEKKAYLAWVDFESASENLDFGIQESQQSEQQETGSDPEQQQPADSEQEKNEEENQPNEPLPQEVNALYERLLQEMESKSEPLGQELPVGQPTPIGRDY